MPRTYAMSYEGEPYYRWVKMFRGVRYRVSCQELRAAVWTKEGSAKLANEWWEQKLRQLRGDPTRIERLIDETKTRQDALVEAIRRHDETQAIFHQLDHVLDDPNDLTDFASHLAEIDHLNRPVQTEHSLAQQAEKFLASELLRGKKPGTHGDLRDYINRIVRDSSLSSIRDVRTITASTITDFYAWVRTSTLSVSVQAKVFGYFRRFVRWLWSEGHFELPRNLDARSFDFPNRTTAVKTYDIAVVKTMLTDLPKRLNLYAHLALNCGMYGVDMAQLKHDEYKNGRITRKRTKTELQTNVPTVQYKLWQETIALLDAYPSTHALYVLTSSTGSPLWTREIKDGKRVKSDLVAQQWRRGRGPDNYTKPPLNLSDLRKVSATIIGGHKDYRELRHLFLGHSPKSIADRHYAAVPQQLFDECIDWLRTQLIG